jgi:hypothetical protein
MIIIFKKSKQNLRRVRHLAVSTLITATMSLGLACGDGDEKPADAGTVPSPMMDAGTSPQADAGRNNLVIPHAYIFDSRFNAGESGLSYSGQITRQVLIKALSSHIDGLTDRIDMGTLTATTGSIVAELNFFLEFDGVTSGDTPHEISTTPATKQTTIGELSTTTKLLNKIAGNDTKTDHKCWNPAKVDGCTSSAFVGWSLTGTTTPEGFVRTLFKLVEDNAIARQSGSTPLDPSGTAITKTYVTADGHDLNQMLQKFLMGAINYSQGTDDYMDDDVDGKGLKCQNTAPDKDGKSYSSLEHAWDEGFGYFGAARDYKNYSDDEIAGKSGRDDYKSGYHDTDGDGKIDLLSEYNFGHSVNAAKRDRGSATGAKTDYTEAAINAFVTGRHIITSSGGDLSTQQMTELKAQRDIAIASWEMAIVGTAVHYINDLLQDMETFNTASYSFYDQAKHWSELKGFALSFQFNPRKKISDADFANLHAKIGDAPVLPTASAAEIAAYKTALIEARGILAASYSINAMNIGDDKGENGW